MSVQISNTCLFLSFPLTVRKVPARLDNIDKFDLPFEFLVDYKLEKHQRGTLIKLLISSLSNLAESLHSYRKLKNKQVAKI